MRKSICSSICLYIALTILSGQLLNGDIFSQQGSGNNSNSLGTANSADNTLSTDILQNSPTETSSIFQLTVTVLLEGFFNGTSMVSDVVTVQLRSSFSPYALVEEDDVTMSVSGVGTADFSTITTSTPYYIVVKHRNSIETWSAEPQIFADVMLSYNFTDAQTKAYGNNLKLKSGKWCTYGGEIANSDQYIDGDDVTSAFNAQGLGGYVLQDVTGDDYVDGDDVTLIFNNQGVGIIKPEVTFEPCPSTVLYEGKTYNTVIVGTQCWLKENLDVGTQINGSGNQTNNSAIEKYCYSDDPNNCDIYGGLYQWDEAMQYVTTEGAQGICPAGWHVPKHSEFQKLATSVGNDGNALKAIGQGSGGGIGTNTSGFSALLAGRRSDEGSFYDLGYRTCIWSMQYNINYYYSFQLFDASSNIQYNSLEFKSRGLGVRCLKDSPPDVPSLLSPNNGATNVAIPTTLNWNASIGATNYRLQISNDSLFISVIYDSSNITSTSQQVVGLSNLTTYYWRVQATNNLGFSDWSTNWSFVTELPRCIGVPTVTYSGKTYNTVLIGAQCWLRENLDVGTRIDGSQNQTNNSIIEKYCYNNDVNYCITYGGLYQWDEAMQYVTTEGAQGICPNGWHLPTVEEFQTLSNSIAGDGNSLKAIGQGFGGGAGSNLSGYSALLAGNRWWSGFYYVGTYGYFQTSLMYDSLSSNVMILRADNSSISIPSRITRDGGFSIRCLKD